MSLDDDAPNRRRAAARVLDIDLEELIWALNSRDPLGDSSHWLNIESGDFLFVPGPDVLDEVGVDPRDDDRWLGIEPIESSAALRVMEDFAEQCGEMRLVRALAQALRERKPFRRFKDALAANPAQRDAWFVFERQAIEVIALQWCEDHGIAPRWIPRLNRSTP